MSWHVHLPWTHIRWYFKRLRSLLFSKPRPTGTYIRVAEDLDDLRARLGTLSYAPNWEFSYDKGEDLNLARVVYEDDPEHPEIEWWHTHVRGYAHEDGTVWLRPHWEPEPTEHGKAHLKGTGFTVPRAMDQLAGDLNTLGIDFDEVEYAGE